MEERKLDSILHKFWKGDRKRAFHELKTASLDPPLALLYEAYCHFEERLFEEAVVCLTEALRQEPSLASAHLLLTLCYMELELQGKPVAQQIQEHGEAYSQLSGEMEDFQKLYRTWCALQ